MKKKSIIIMMMFLMMHVLPNIRDANKYYYDALCIRSIASSSDYNGYFALFGITSSCSDNYDSAFPASETSHCGINSHDNKHLLNFTRTALGVWKLGQENHVGDLFCSLRCVSVDAKCGLCAIASSSREVSR